MEGQTIPMLVAEGTHYEVGQLIGKTFRTSISKMIEVWSAARPIEEYLESDEGKTLMDRYLAEVGETYPQYLEEIQGMADGSGVPMRKILAFNLKYELPRPALKKHDHCSDVIINNKNYMLGAHTEDGLEYAQGLCYIIQVHITDTERRGKFWVEEESFTAFCWPGKFPGSCFGFNQHGLTHTGNAMTSPVSQESGTPTVFLARATLAAKSFDEVEQILLDEGHGIGYGYSFNIGDHSSGAFCNFEVMTDKSGKRSKVIRTEIPKGAKPYFHANIYEHISIDLEALGSVVDYSLDRIKRFHQFSEDQLQTLQDVINVIGDTQPATESAQFPIHNKRTLATGILDLNNHTLSVYSGNPKTCEPEYIFTIPTMSS